MLNEMKDGKKFIKIVRLTPWIITFCLVLFSVFMSSMENNESQALSGWISQEIQSVVLDFASFARNATNFEIYEFTNFFVRKLAHIFIFFHIFILLTMSFRTLVRNIWSSMAISYICTLILAVLDEVHQIFVAGRTASVEDVIIDMTGAFGGVLTVVSIIFLNKFIKFLSRGWKK